MFLFVVLVLTHAPCFGFMHSATRQFPYATSLPPGTNLTKAAGTRSLEEAGSGAARGGRTTGEGAGGGAGVGSSPPLGASLLEDDESESADEVSALPGSLSALSSPLPVASSGSTPASSSPAKPLHHCAHSQSLSPKVRRKLLRLPAQGHLTFHLRLRAKHHLRLHRSRPWKMRVPRMVG